MPEMKKVKIGNVVLHVANDSTEGAVDVRDQEDWLSHIRRDKKQTKKALDGITELEALLKPSK